MKKLRILQFPIANTYGGITHYAINNWLHMDKKKFSCDFATMSKELDFEEDLRKSGSNIFHISCYAEDDEDQFCKEFSDILDNGYDVVHLHTKQWKSLCAEKICKQKRVKKVIIHAHSTQCENADELERMYETRNHFEVRNEICENLATDFLACSNRAAEWLFGDKVPEKKIKIMKNAIETERFLFDAVARNDVRQKLNIADTDIIIGNVGRLSYSKNQMFLIDLISKMNWKIPELKLMLVGGGELYEQLMGYAYSKGVEDKVIFTGRLSDASRLYSAMDIFCLPSNFEGFPISLVEALASGLRCFISDRITEEALVNSRIKMLSLDVDIWAHELEMELFKLKNNADFRNDMKKIIESIGYDISKQIKNVEQEYLAE